MKLNVVLYQPEIPQNTGNIARTCAVTGAKLHLVKPLGFEVTDKTLKRAGMDYWYEIEVFYYESLDEFLNIHSKDNCLMQGYAKNRQGFQDRPRCAYGYRRALGQLR